MTIAERRHLALLEHQHRQLTQACQRLVLSDIAFEEATHDTPTEDKAMHNRAAAIAEITELLEKWERIET